MKIKQYQPTDTIEQIIQDAHTICLDFDPDSNCKSYLEEKINQKNTKIYLLENNEENTGLAILEIIDKYYGNLIIHTLHESDEALFAVYLKEIIKDHVLELIQFRSGFGYRDTFIELGYREKERARMMHHDIGQYAGYSPQKHISFKPLSKEDNQTSGTISYLAHQHRQYIECYDVYDSPKKRAQFANTLREGTHGESIKNASLLMLYQHQPIGVIEMVKLDYFGESIGWIMDVAVQPDFQGMGFGPQLIKKSLFEAYQSGYNKVGLGVTLSNQSARQLYDHLGFEEYEIFVEIIGL